MATNDRAGNAYGSPSAAKTNAERAGRVPTQQETDQHTIAHADGFIGPRTSETWGSSPRDRQIVTYSVPTNRQDDEGRTVVEKRAQPDPASDYSPSADGAGTRDRGTAPRMAHLDNIGVGIKRNSTRMFQHKGTGAIIENRQQYSGGFETNTSGTTAAGKGMDVQDNYALSGQPHKTGAPNNPQDDPENWTDISDTVRGTQTYKNNRRY
jgi:hypothetical protein